MLAVNLAALLVFVFGASAYGSAAAVSLRRTKPIWGAAYDGPASAAPLVDGATLGLFLLSFTWFVVQALIEVRRLLGGLGEGWLDVLQFLAFLFPPLIMHTIYRETACGNCGSVPSFYRWLPAAMYVLSPAVGVYLLASIFRWVPRPSPLGAWIGISMGGMFTLASIYSAALLLRRPREEPTADERRTRHVMALLFALMVTLFIALTAMQERRLVAEVLDRVARAAPIYFLIASVYFENRFAFYDLVVKRALLLLLSIVTLSLYLAATMPWLNRLPEGAARPWLFAVMLVPLGVVMPWLYARSERWLDRMWLGREYTPVDAVKHVLGAMQPASDERSLVAATEARLAEMFGGPVVVRVDGAPLSAGSAVEGEVALASPGGGEIRIVVLRSPGTRRVLSEDLALLRSLAGVFGVMLENLRLQQRRQEQEQVAHGLRLQSSRSELKALRAQINPHFLFNALNAIASLIHTDPRRADEVVEQLAEVFRYTLRRSDSEWAPLDQELAFVRAYLDVEQARFGQRLVCTINSDHGSPPPQARRCCCRRWSKTPSSTACRRSASRAASTWSSAPRTAT